MSSIVVRLLALVIAVAGIALVVVGVVYGIYSFVPGLGGALILIAVGMVVASFRTSTSAMPDSPENVVFGARSAARRARPTEHKGLGAMGGFVRSTPHGDVLLTVAFAAGGLMLIGVGVATRIYTVLPGLGAAFLLAAVAVLTRSRRESRTDKTEDHPK